MSTLKLRVGAPLPTEGGSAAQLVARLRALDDSGRSLPGSQQQALVPVSNDPRATAQLDIDPGRYIVEVTLPTGEQVSQLVQVGEAMASIVLAGTSSPGGWLGLQQRAGRDEAVASRRPQASTSLPTSTRGGSPARSTRAFETPGPPRYGESLGLVSRPNAGAGGEDHSDNGHLRWPQGEAAIMEPGRSIVWVESRSGSLTNVGISGNLWSLLPQLIGSTAAVMAAVGPPPLQALRARTVTDRSATFDIPSRSRASSAMETRRYGIIARRQGAELLCVPGDWRRGDGRLAPLSIVVERPQREADFSAAVVIGDAQLTALLGMLASGALPAARELYENAVHWLAEKSENPYAAAAGGYALIGTVENDANQEWMPWVGNLMTRFAALPDGAVQLATLRLRLRRGRSDVEESAQLFKTAFNRGLPLYTLGLRWLLEGLIYVGEWDEEAKVMAQQVRGVVARSNPQSPLTSLRLGTR